MTTSSSAAGEFFGVGTLSGESPELTWTILSEFDHTTYERYSKAMANALAPTNNFNIALVERNLQSYLSIQKYVGRLLRLGRKFGTPNGVTLSQSVMIQIINWLTSFRLFLDHAETDLKRRFGEGSPQLLSFESATSTIYDGSMGYRFISKFRNYVQHCGAPLSNLTIGRSESPASEHLQKVSFTLDRDQLLRDFNWKAVKRDLESMSASFELEPLIVETMNGIREINRILLDISIEEGARTIGDVREAFDLIPTDADGVPNLIRYFIGENNDQVVFSYQPFLTAESIERYEAVRNGFLQASDLHSRNEPEIPVFEPETLNERFHSDNRAVQIMTMWFSEGGSTSALGDYVNKLIQEDASVTPILTGFFNMTAVLIHLSAGAIGIDPTGLIGGLLDQYSSGVQDSGGGDSR